MTTEQRQRLASELREALSLAQGRRSAVHMSQYHAGLLLEFLDDVCVSDRDESEVT